MGKFLFSVLLLVAGTTSLMSQSIKINYKPGSVSKEELEMDSYPLDTTASAVLLAKTYEVKVSFDQRLSLKRTETVYKRYKVLKDAGKDCADQSLLYLADNRFDESIYGIKVTVAPKADLSGISDNDEFDVVYDVLVTGTPKDATGKTLDGESVRKTTVKYPGLDIKAVAADNEKFVDTFFYTVDANGAISAKLMEGVLD